MRTAIVFLALVVSVAAQDVKKAAAVFEKNCVGCHSGTAKMGGLDLQSSTGLQKGGVKGVVIVPGKSEESRLYLMMAGKLQPSMPVGGKVAPEELEAVKRWIEGGAAGTYEISTVARAPEIKSKQPSKPQIFSLAYSPDSKMLAAGGYKELRLIDSATGKVQATVSGFKETVRAVAFSKDGKRIAAAGGVAGVKGEVKVYDLGTRSFISSVEGHDDTIYAVAF